MDIANSYHMSVMIYTHTSAFGYLMSYGLCMYFLEK